MSKYSPDMEVELSDEQLFEWSISLAYANAVVKASEPTLKERGHQAYDDWVEYGLTTNVRGRYWMSRLAEFRDISGSRYIDVGCGFGGCCIEAARRGAIATGIDINPWFLNLAEENARSLSLQSVRFTQGNIEDTELMYSLGQFDLITCLDVLEHVKDIRQSLETISRMMAAGGLALLGVPNGRSLQGVLQDPHLGLFGISLLETPMAHAYVSQSGYGTYDFMGSYLTFSEYQCLFDAICLERRILHKIPETDYISSYECHQLIESITSRSDEIIESKPLSLLALLRKILSESSYHKLLQSLISSQNIFRSYLPLYKEFIAFEVHSYIEKFKKRIHAKEKETFSCVMQDYFVPYWEFLIYKPNITGNCIKNT